MPHTELWVVAQWLSAVLNVSGVTVIATGGVYRFQAPPEAEVPYVVFRPAANSDLIPMSSGAIKRAYNRALWDVIGVGTELQAETVNTLARTMDDLLLRRGGTTTDGIIITCTRETEIFFQEVDEGVSYVYNGGSYRIAGSAT